MYYLLTLLFIVGVVAFLVHQYAYRALYRKLLARSVVDFEYKPDWTSIAGAGACMGYITKLNREVGTDQLTVEEIALLRRVTLSYTIGVPTAFILTCAVFWLVYQQRYGN